jgi:predicted carbohydrate-binding protein with CBM5 and CBM33 domain
LDVCADYIDCAASCDCNDQACQQTCLDNQSAECNQCFLDQGICAGTMCSAELMMCGG